MNPEEGILGDGSTVGEARPASHRGFPLEGFLRFGLDEGKEGCGADGTDARHDHADHEDAASFLSARPMGGVVFHVLEGLVGDDDYRVGKRGAVSMKPVFPAR